MMTAGWNLSILFQALVDYITVHQPNYSESIFAKKTSVRKLRNLEREYIPNAATKQFGSSLVPDNL
jgi:DNA polymerase sigma